MKAQASPNIAFIKYWGKLSSTSDETRNLALNPSLSLTLSKARTETTVELGGDGIHVRLDGKPASDADRRKIHEHLARLARAFELPEPTSYRVESHNNFPAGTGIASSASGFAALTLAGTGALSGRTQAEALLRERPELLSALARRGSGSAARSLQGPFTKWDGEAAFKLPIDDWRLRDTLVVFSKEPKKISSSQGHEAALSSPLLAARLDRLPERIAALETALRKRDLAALGPHLEAEALEMHEVARNGNPPADYLLPQTRAFLAALPAQRNYFFTIDAGPNLHFISEEPIRTKLLALLESLGIQAEILEDEAGSGASFLDS
jgi:diphosphomevalonate decarboxylase